MCPNRAIVQKAVVEARRIMNDKTVVIVSNKRRRPSASKRRRRAVAKDGCPLNPVCQSGGPSPFVMRLLTQYRHASIGRRTSERRSSLVRISPSPRPAVRRRRHLVKHVSPLRPSPSLLPAGPFPVRHRSGSSGRTDGLPNKIVVH